MMTALRTAQLSYRFCFFSCTRKRRTHYHFQSLSGGIHLSRRLIGERIVYPWSGVRRRCPSVRRPQCSNIFSETAGRIKAKFYVEPPRVGGTIFCSRHLCHMTKMAATPIYGKNPSKIFFSRTGRPIFTKLRMYHWGLQPIIVCSNDDPGVTLTYFTARSNSET